MGTLQGITPGQKVRGKGVVGGPKQRGDLLLKEGGGGLLGEGGETNSPRGM